VNDPAVVSAEMAVPPAAGVKGAALIVIVELTLESFVPSEMLVAVSVVETAALK
jgi:hypothetical protein